MEIEPRGRKRRQQEEEARRGARNPVRRDARGHYEVDQQEIARPEYQELLEALYTHYERGARAPLPYEIFPVREVPRELLIDLVGGDVHTYIALMGSDPEMRKQLMPLAPQMVRLNYADVVLLIAMACDTPLIQDIQVVNELYYTGTEERSGVWHQGPMGFWPWAVRQDVNFVWSTRPEEKKRVVRSLPEMIAKALADRAIPTLNSALRVNDRDNYNDYLRGTTGTGFMTKYESYLNLRDGWQFFAHNGPFALPDASVCSFSQVSAIRLCVELLRIGAQHDLLWANEHVQSGAFLAFPVWTTYETHSKLPEDEQRSENDPSDERAIGQYRWRKVRLFATELAAWLNNEGTRDNVYYQFRRMRPLDEQTEEPFSVDAAHLLSVIQDYERTLEENFALVGQRDPLYIELISMDRLAPRACALAGVRRCERWWFLLLRAMWEVTRGGLGWHRRVETDEPEVAKPTGSRLCCSRLCCSCRAERATRLDARFALPFCPAERCQRQVFSRLHSAGLWRPEGGVVVK